MSLSGFLSRRRSGYELIINPSLKAPAYVVILIFVWLLSVACLTLRAIFLYQAGSSGVFFLILGVVVGCGLTFMYSRNGISVDKDRVCRTVGDKRHSVERTRVKTVLFRAGAGQLLGADGKAILVFGSTFTPQQMEALAEHLGCPCRLYEKPNK